MKPTRDDCLDPRGECRECGRVMMLKVDGTLRYHFGGTQWVDYRCNGSGTRPVTAGVSREATP